MNIFKKPRTLAQQLFAAMGFLGSQLAANYMREPRTSRKRHPLMITASDKEIADWNHTIVMLKLARKQRRIARDEQRRKAVHDVLQQAVVEVRDEMTVHLNHTAVPNG